MENINSKIKVSISIFLIFFFSNLRTEIFLNKYIVAPIGIPIVIAALKYISPLFPNKYNKIN